MIKRPKPGEDEEDLLRMQDEFLREKNENESYKPSAQVVNLRRTEHRTTKRSNANAPSTRKQSVYAQSRGLNQNEKNQVETLRKPEDDKVYFPEVNPSVMGDIVQKNYNNFLDLDSLANPMPSAGFPMVTKCNSAKDPFTKAIDVLQTEKNVNKSQISKPAEMEVDVTTQNTNVTSHNHGSSDNQLNLPSKSYMVSNNDASDIHSENVKVLSGMSEKEILEEQQKLLSSLDPNILGFVKAKRKQALLDKKKEHFVNINEKVDEMVVECAGSDNVENDDDTLWDNDVLCHPEINTWLHFDSLEKDKLQWMKGIKESKIDKPNEPYEARFDFSGHLLPYTIEYTEKTKILFHHGEEPDRPGYSISELIELSRSSVTQQRVMALNAIAGLLEYYSAGMYKGVIEIPLSKLFFVIRFALDENKVIMLEPALKAMRNLLYNRIDEACLDALIGFEEGTVQPCLENDKSEIEELDSTESDLKDFHLAEIDIVTAIIRTDILQRLYYIMDTIRPNLNCVQYSLQILIRLARDSVEVANKIVQTEHLVISIIKNFIPITGVNFRFHPNIVYNRKPVLAALKLMRILSLQSRETGEVLISKYDILKPVLEYINSGVDGTYGLRLQLESYCILTNLIHYDLGVDDATALFPVMLTAMYKHIQGTDIFVNTVVLSSTHAAVVLQLINKLLNCNKFDVAKYGKQIYTLIKDGVAKWMAQVASIENYTCGHLRVVCSVLECCNTIATKAEAHLPFLSDAIKALSKSNGIKKIMDNLILSSNLLSGIEEKNLSPNLMCLGGAVIDSGQKVLPVLNVTSPIPFLLSLFKVLVNMEDKNIANPYIEMVLPYLKRLIDVVPSLSLNWFTRMETCLVYNIITLSLKSNINENLKDITYVVANKLCFMLRIDKTKELNFLFDRVIFNTQWLAAERLFNLMSLSEAEELSKALTSIEDIKLCYSRVINLRNLEDTPNIVLRKWQEPILPRDWIYLPILSLYSKIQETPITTPTVTGDHAKRVTLLIGQEKELILRCSLEWILFNELCFTDLLNDIHVTDRLCRIMCVFLCDNSLFLDSKIKFLLHNCTKILFKKSAEFNFDKPLTGLNNFQDFYTQLLEQFQSVSYGDHNFAACVLVPLAQHHNIKWRKTLWSEYAGCLRALDCPEDYLCYGLNKYLYPEETDESLIKSYFRALSSNLLRPGTIVNKIALHHTESFKIRL